jgi:hypothetical protein
MNNELLSQVLTCGSRSGCATGSRSGCATGSSCSRIHHL